MEVILTMSDLGDRWRENLQLVKARFQDRLLCRHAVAVRFLKIGIRRAGRERVDRSSALKLPQHFVVLAVWFTECRCQDLLCGAGPFADFRSIPLQANDGVE